MQEARQAGMQACGFLGVCVFRRNFARVGSYRYHLGNCAFPVILGPNSPAILGLASLVYTCTYTYTPSSATHNAADSLNNFHHFFMHQISFSFRITTTIALLTADTAPLTQLLGAVHNLNRNREAMINNMLEQNRNCN